MPQVVDFEGQRHEFPDDFTQGDIATALGSLQKGANQAQPAPSTPAAPLPSDMSWIRQKLREKALEGGQNLRERVLPGAVEQLGVRPSVDSQLAGTVTDIPKEIYSAGKGAITQAAEGLNPFSDTNRFNFRAQINAPFSERIGHLSDQYANVGRGLMAVPDIAAAPISGTARAAVGHPYSMLTGLPYEQAKDAVDLAMTGMAPRGASTLGARVAPAKVPTGEQLYRSAKAGYRSPEVATVEMHPQSVADLSQRIEHDLLTEGFRPAGGQSGAGQTFSLVKELSPQDGIKSVKIADYDSVAKALRNVAKERDFQNKPTPDAAAASLSLRHLDEYLTKHLPANPQEVIAGDISNAVPILKAAQGDWSAMKKGGEIATQLSRAERQAARGGSGTNIENTLRQKISPILDNPKRSVGYRPDELAKAEEIVRGTFTRNALRRVGKLGFGDGLSLLLHAGAVGPSGGASIPIGIAGTVARKAGEALTARAGRQLGEMIRARSPLAQSQQPTPMLPPSRASLLASALLRQPSSLVPSLRNPAIDYQPAQ